MGQEVIAEEDHPCPCGKGVLHIEVLEHDVWASGRHSRWELRCRDCEPMFREYRQEGALIPTKEHEKIEHDQHELYERRRAVGRKSVERYLPQWSEHVKALKFMTSIHTALDRHESVQTFRKKMRSGHELDEAIEFALASAPERALKQINVEDVEIAAELEAIEKDEATLEEYVAKVPKHPIPNIDMEY